MEKKDAKKTSQFIQFAVAAADFAIRQAGLNTEAEFGDRAGVVSHLAREVM